jgi:hypothetical protein
MVFLAANVPVHIQNSTLPTPFACSRALLRLSPAQVLNTVLFCRYDHTPTDGYVLFHSK